MFVDINYHKNLAVVVSNLVLNGIRIRGVKFVLGERSASMVRQGVLSFVDEKIAQALDEKITMGLDIGETVLSKWQAYRGLALSSCHCIDGYVPKMIVIPDYDAKIPAQNIRYLCDEHKTFVNEEGKEVDWVQKGIAEDTRDIEINAFDGVGIMHRNVASRIEKIAQSTTPITTCIFRAPFIKGCLHVMDYEKFFVERGVEYIKDIWGKWHSVHDEMIILTKSMYKGYAYFRKHNDVSDWDAYWDAFSRYGHCIAVAKANFTLDEESVYTRCNYQILQTLNLPYEQFRSLADESVRWINKVVDGDTLYTKCFLGIKYDKCKALNPYVAAIAKNDAMIAEPNVRKYLLSLVQKYLDEMKAGKLFIKSCFKFLAPDMVALMEHVGGLPVVGCLAADEFWTRGKEVEYDGEYLITRNPHICKSENVVMAAAHNDTLEKWCGHLVNVCMINIKSITPQRLNGADFDGDLILVTDNKTMLDGVDRDLKIVIDAEDKVTALAEPDIPQNRIACILRTTKSMIGEYSNYASVYHNRLPQAQDQKKRYEDFVDIISVLTGKSIDYAKTGILYPMPRSISKYGRPLPYFMKYRSAYYARQTLSRAPSNMNRLCWDLEKWSRGVKFKRSAGFDHSVMIDKSVLYDDKTADAVRSLFNEFCTETSRMSRYQSVVRKYDTKDIKEKFSKDEACSYVADWDACYAKYRERAEEICDDERVLAAIAVKIVYEENKNKGMKFPWIVAPNGVIDNIVPQDDGLVPMRTEVGECMYLGKHYTLVPKSYVPNDDIFDDIMKEGLFID